MPKNLTDADLKVIDDKATELLDLMRDAVEKIKKTHVDPLTNLGDLARSAAIYAREASNLGVFLLMQDRMQTERAEIERLRRQRARADADSD